MAKLPKHRTETDSFGPIEVPADRYWGAQTQRSLQNFRIGADRMPTPVVRAFGIVKKAAASLHGPLGIGLVLARFRTHGVKALTDLLIIQ